MSNFAFFFRNIYGLISALNLVESVVEDGDDNTAGSDADYDVQRTAEEHVTWEFKYRLMRFRYE